MTPTRIQPVTNPPGEHALFITLSIHPTDDATQAILDFTGEFTALIRSLNKRFANTHFNAVMGFGREAWTRLFPHKNMPKELVTFKPLQGKKHTAVATGGDLFFHIRGDNFDSCYEMAALIEQKIGTYTTSLDETQGFRYLDGRAIIGFVDGTENPEPIIAGEYALIGDEDSEFKNGSYAFTQKYLHDMTAWRGLNTEQQEKVIGRHKFDDIELSDDEKPANAHNQVSKAKDSQGNELKILRANVAFANPSKKEYGTYFIGYSRSFAVTHQMLTQMFIGNAEGVTDRLLDFSTPITGALFFIPTYDFLDSVGDE